MTRGTWLSWIVSLYEASCVLPAFNRAPGIVCLIWIPWVYVFPAWWANLAFFVGCSLLGGRHPWASRFCAILAALLAASLPLGLRAANRVQIGYVVWLASIALLAVASFALPARPFKPAKVTGLEDL